MSEQLLPEQVFFLSLDVQNFMLHPHALIDTIGIMRHWYKIREGEKTNEEETWTHYS